MADELKNTEGSGTADDNEQEKQFAQEANSNSTPPLEQQEQEILDILNHVETGSLESTIELLDNLMKMIIKRLRTHADILSKVDEANSDAAKAALQEMNSELQFMGFIISSTAKGDIPIWNRDIMRELRNTIIYLVETVPGLNVENFSSGDTSTEAHGEPITATQEQLPRITVNGRGASDIEYPLDKVNANIWALLNDAPKNGQLSLNIGTEKRGSRKQADIIYSINFEELENAGLNTVKRLTAFDKRVYIAASALFNGNSDYMTVSQIYATMGNESRPNARDIEKIYTSLEKMRRLSITLDNFTPETSEHKTYPNMPKFVYNGMLLPWESIDAVVNGQRADGVIHLFREPPLVSFAKERKQITTVSRKLLASPISKTDAHLLIDDYLIERISHIKNSKGKISNKLLYSTIFDKTGTTSRCQKSRGKETVMKYLEHYKQCGFIKDYKEAADGVTIIY